MIYIIRHGQTEHNQAHRLQGQSDHPLNETGRQQARQARESLEGISFQTVYSSPLERAIETARIVVPDQEVIVDERLIEIDYGPYEGADLKHLPAELKEFFQDFIHHQPPQGMESLEQVKQRARSFLEDIQEGSGDVLISTHAVMMKGLLEVLDPQSNGQYWSTFVGNCAVYQVDPIRGIVQEYKKDLEAKS